ncbi:SIS domain-containing protein [Conexibacter sp. CPCC 206217]|uniref:SIS domain-containing protein n=1 Tax=Conexibacter sp. CPCC 206217 TaxID=3064574 RepID=UPI00271E61E8|nr:SIS domain-containing protein [Conexibacter sp. CPCC 206217]MDO8210312.1 SIS domain-containing protein [Conexibacter sp. CPCC 206217]
MSPAAATGADRVDALLAARVAAGERFFGAESERLARLCHAMAERFARGGRLLAFGASTVDVSDARHVAVEFVHPVIVGKRALPALALSPAEVALLARADDIAIAFGGGAAGAPSKRSGAAVEAAVRDAARGGCLTLAFTRVGAEWELIPPTADAFVAQELAETAYHVLWELVHVFFEHRGLLAGRTAGPVHDSGASSFLYPFLAEREDDLGAVLADVRASALTKSREIGELRAQTLREGRVTLLAAAAALRASFDTGGTLLALGNGGSATDAMDAVADLREPPPWPARRALDLTADPAILTAIANDVGTEALFARQVIAYGRPGDTLLAFSTSGGSPNVILALQEARRRRLATIALVGYDGGRVAAERLADHVIVTRSEHIPRIQEAQASAWHVLRELIEADL